jgi:hypothetical protein
LTQSTNLLKELCWFESGIGDDQMALRSHPDYRVQRGQLFAVIKQKAKPKFGFFTNLLS